MSNGAAHGKVRSRDWFYVWLSGAMLLVVLSGFAQTYYLRSVLGTEQLAPGLRELPTYLHLHGIALTAWFVLGLVQSTLIAARRADLHRPLGWLGAVLAVAVVAATVQPLRGAASDSLSDIPADALPLVIVGDVFVLIAFAVLVSAAVIHRRDKETHLRLMLCASSAVVGTAASRLPGALALAAVVIPAVQFGVPIALIVHDWLRLRRIHGATIVGAVLVVGGTIAGVILGLTSFGRAFVAALA